MNNSRKQAFWAGLLAGFLASSIFSSNAQGAATPQTSVASRQSLATVSSPAARPFSSIHTVGSVRGEMRYREICGIDNLKLVSTASGSLIRFSYRVLDQLKARELNDKKKDPYLLVEGSGTKIGVETAERVGQLRQTVDPVSGREYWMIFSNPRHPVIPGDKVDIVVGTFHAFGLFVEAPEAEAVRKH
jgi:hypothetical protein